MRLGRALLWLSLAAGCNAISGIGDFVVEPSAASATATASSSVVVTVGTGQGAGGFGGQGGQGGQGQGGGPPSCYRPGDAGSYTNPGTTVARPACTPTQVFSWLTACEKQGATLASCNAWYFSALSCGECIYSTNPTVYTPAMMEIPDPSMPGSYYLYGNTPACEALLQNKASCGPALTQRDFCDLRVCVGCKQNPDFEDCFAAAELDACKAETQAVPADCQPLWSQAFSDPRCSAADFVDIAAAVLGVMCNASGPVAASLGYADSCALEQDGTARCWGMDDKGELGFASGAAVTSATKVPGFTGLQQIALGDYHGCALGGDGSVYCWGADDKGQLGDGMNVDRAMPAQVKGVSAIGIALGGSHSCAVSQAGTAGCWGENDSGQLGNGTSGASSSTPQAVVSLTGIAQLKLGGRHTCALQEPTGAVYCWGANSAGQLGDGTTMARSAPVGVTGLMGVQELALGGQHSCARRGDNSVVCWGDNEFGQLGTGDTLQRSAPTPVAGLSAVAGIAAGGSHTCARKFDGSVLCWGANFAGQLGNGQEDPPVPIAPHPTPAAVAGIMNAIDILAGGAHSCARTIGGATYCWGWNLWGQLGDGTTTDRLAPTLVPGL